MRFVSAIALVFALGTGGLWAPGAAADDKPFETISFSSKDSLSVTADVYAPNPASAPMIVLFHQAGWSRGEYREIAPKLNKMGFNCLAVDQRSGKAVNGVSNETASRARAAGKGTTYVDALPDMRAALELARKRTTSKVIAWGSSYSSALVLRLAGAEPALIDIALAFAPGEYFARFGKSKTWIAQAAKKIEQPVFVTSARDEYQNWQAIYEAIPSKRKAVYRPTTRGQHGSRALWAKFSDSDGYWKAVSAFLAKHARR